MKSPARKRRVKCILIYPTVLRGKSVLILGGLRGASLVALSLRDTSCLSASSGFTDGPSDL